MKANNITLPTVSKAAANYQPFVIQHGIVTISGQLPFKDGAIPDDFKGHLGKQITVEQGIVIARQCGLNILAQLDQACEGEWNRVVQCLKLGVFVASTPEFDQQPAVANGASDLMIDYLGSEKGAHARSAVGVAALPFGVAVEIDAQFLIK